MLTYVQYTLITTGTKNRGRSAVVVMVYLCWLVEEHPNICEGLVYLSQPLSDDPDFVLYRLLAGLTEAINTCFWLHKDLLRRTLR